MYFFLGFSFFDEDFDKEDSWIQFVKSNDNGSKSERLKEVAYAAKRTINPPSNAIGFTLFRPIFLSLRECLLRVTQGRRRRRREGEAKDVQVLERSGGWIWGRSQRSALQYRRALLLCLGLLDSLPWYLQGKPPTALIPYSHFLPFSIF